MKQTLLFVVTILATGLCSAGEVTRSAFTTMIDQREPVDSVEQINTSDNKIMFFTELSGMNGQKAIHRWMHNDEIRAEVAFDIGSDRWRVWSSKSLIPAWQGLWTVEVVDDEGNVVGSQSFTYGSQ